MHCSRAQGSLDQNKETIEGIVQGATCLRKISHLHALLQVIQYIREEGPIVSTQDVGRFYYKAKNEHEFSQPTSSSIFEILSKHLNILQVYINGKAYIIENYHNNVKALLHTITQTVDRQKVVNDHTLFQLEGIFQTALNYMDTARDKQLLKGLMAHLTSINVVAKMQGIQSKKGTRRARNLLVPNLDKYAEIQRRSQLVRSDLTCTQQYNLTKRIVSKKKANQLRCIAAGRGRKLKSDTFPDLAAALEFAFGEDDVADGGGGLESHPRLTTGVLYRSCDSATTMKRAREIVLSLAPKDFNISLSACYNYTETYRMGTRQAKRHHAGLGVNANISLQKPPRTGVEELVVNLHWSTANVNYIVDTTEKRGVVISKDAKAIIPGDITPVQRPGHSWSKRPHPDHTWDQSRCNAITPMTFLFVNTKVHNISEIHVATSESTSIRVTRTGQAVTFLNLSFYEPDTTFKCLNELFLLLTKPSLDILFRDPIKGTLKKEFVFVVDNGPAEQPASPLVQMCLVRLLKLLDLRRVTQISFAEYHSKRNFVERVHAEENMALYKHGPFKSDQVHSKAAVGTDEHHKNLECMCTKVRQCLSTASFGGCPLQCYRGVKKEDWLFTDEANLKDFLALSEDLKESFPCANYTVHNSHILDDLVSVWNISEQFVGNYVQDYQQLLNNQTCWRDKYTCSIFSCSSLKLKQPLPDYTRWFESQELHYLPIDERQELEEGVWDEISGLFIPSNILDLCVKVLPHPPEDIQTLIGLLAWLPLEEVKDYYQKSAKNELDAMRSDRAREVWKSHPLYALKKTDLEQLCRKHRIPVTSSMPKHDLVRLVSKSKNETPLQPKPIYSGKLTTVPTGLSQLKKLTVGKLRAIIHCHGFPTMGTKDQLVIRVAFLRQGKTSEMFKVELKQLMDLVKICYQLILAERKKCYLRKVHHTYQRRTYAYSSVRHTSVSLPQHVCRMNDLQNLFEPLLDFLNIIHTSYKEKDQQSTIGLMPNKSAMDPEDIRSCICEVGACIKVKWTAEEVGDSGWRPGWYRVVVQSYDSESDTLTVTYPTEEGCVYI